MNARDVNPYTGETPDMLREERVRLVLDMTREEAGALASSARDGDGEVYASVAKPIATVIADALVTAGMGQG